ncbi:MAG: hypothetical protein JWM95_1570, partial [Gemmatimonadetes bacterium]|nr:hypothetical protein [Gemmatimonadota bacterium]
IPTLTPLAKLYVKEIAEALGINPDYLSVTEAEEALAQADTQIPTELLRHAYRVNFMESSRFEKTLFHFLLSRLQKAKDDYAADHVLGFLMSNPEETDWILNHYSAVRSPDTGEAVILRYLSSAEAVYPFQHYQVLRWRSQFSVGASEEFVRFVRRIYAAPQSPSYLRSAARHFLSIHGSNADLDELAASYASLADEVARAECLVSIFRMETKRRNAIYGQAKKDGMLPTAAIALVKGDNTLRELGVT